MTDPDTVWRLLTPWLSPDEAHIVRAVVYRFHATVASTMRSGRIFLAGDAAHQMPPFLGQGLCSGVRDAANLSWKFASVKAGVAGEALLDTYDAERRPHAAGVVAHAADTGRTIDQLSGRGDTGADLENAYGGQRPFPHLTAGFVAGDHPFTGRAVRVARDHQCRQCGDVEPAAGLAPSVDRPADDGEGVGVHDHRAAGRRVGARDVAVVEEATPQRLEFAQPRLGEVQQ